MIDAIIKKLRGYDEDILFVTDPYVRLMNHMGSDTLVCDAARGSTGNSGRTYTKAQNQGLINSLVREGHRLPFEHPHLTFRLEIPIKVARQLVKYRHSSWSELSGRYRELYPTFFITDEYRPLGQTGKPMEYNMVELPDAVHRMWVKKQKKEARRAWRGYKRSLKNGVTKEVARDLLPVNIMTEVTWTMSLLEALHVISQRVDWGDAAKQRSHPMYETEQVARRMWDYIVIYFPLTAKAFRENGYKL